MDCTRNGAQWIALEKNKMCNYKCRIHMFASQWQDLVDNVQRQKKINIPCSILDRHKGFVKLRLQW